MSSAGLRSRSRYRAWLAVLGFLSFLAFGSWLWITLAANAKWAAMEARIPELRRQISEDRESRGPIRGSAPDGNAWDEYAAALVPMNPFPEYRQLVEVFHTSDHRLRAGVPRQITVTRLEPYREALRHLREGARRIPGPRPDTMYFENIGTKSHSGALRLVSVALWESRSLWESGSADEAADLLLDLLVFIGDVARGAPWTDFVFGTFSWARSLEALKELLLSSQLSGPKLEELSRTLDELDAVLPKRVLMLRRQLLMLGESLCRYGECRDGAGHYQVVGEPETGQRIWRYGYSKRLLCASLFLWLDSWVIRMVDMDQLSWVQLEARRREFGGDLEDSPSSVATRRSLLFEPTSDSEIRRVRSRMRLLSMAATGLRTGDPGVKKDPFGDAMHFARTEKSFKLWSVGYDGVDQNGSGDWEGGRDADMVLEVGK